jgi:hypothetical protein
MLEIWLYGAKIIWKVCKAKRKCQLYQTLSHNFPSNVVDTIPKVSTFGKENLDPGEL